jgi:hypothetical protein
MSAASAALDDTVGDTPSPVAKLVEIPAEPEFSRQFVKQALLLPSILGHQVSLLAPYASPYLAGKCLSDATVVAAYVVYDARHDPAVRGTLAYTLSRMEGPVLQCILDTLRDMGIPVMQIDLNA